jgi:DNA-binding transcriptional LysR family regulator
MLFLDSFISELQWNQMQASDRIGRRMKLHDLRVLIAVVEAGSMSRAAKLLNTTQPAVSRSIAELEDMVGVRLLDRGRHGAEPTEYGRALLAGGAAMFDDLRQAVKNIEFLADPTVGEVRIGTHDPLIAGVLPTVFERLRMGHPGISVQVISAPTNAQQFRDLRERRVDVVLGRITPPIEEDIHVEVLFHDRAVVVAGPNTKWTVRRNVKLSELSNEPWYLPLPDTTIGLQVADAFRASGMPFPPKAPCAAHLCWLVRLFLEGPIWEYFPHLYCSSLPVFRS